MRAAEKEKTSDIIITSHDSMAGMVFLPYESLCVSSWQSVVLETPVVAGTTTEAVGVEIKM